MSEYKIDEQEWKSWPKAVMMRRDWTTNGHDHRKEVRRYVPDDESVMLRREVNRLRSTVKYLESRIMDSERFENAKLKELFEAFYQCSRQTGCDHCGYRDACTVFDEMRELGIEVDR